MELSAQQIIKETILSLLAERGTMQHHVLFHMVEELNHNFQLTLEDHCNGFDDLKNKALIMIRLSEPYEDTQGRSYRIQEVSLADWPKRETNR